MFTWFLQVNFRVFKMLPTHNKKLPEAKGGVQYYVMTVIHVC